MKLHFRPSVEVQPARTPGKVALNMKFTLQRQDARDAGLCLYLRRLEPGDTSAACIDEILKNHATRIEPQLKALAEELRVFESDT